MTISRRLLARIFVERIEKAGTSRDLIRSLAAYIIENNATKQADMVISDITAEFARRGQVLAQVTTATPLSSAQRSAITATIKNATDARTVELIEKVELAIIGGMRLALPGKELDATIMRQLQTLRGVK